jgi:LmbE family N-acetylglucosaminyl deacetylase
VGQHQRIVVVAPHLDDAALSLGATIVRAVRAGSRVTVVTVFAGDPTSEASAGPWDELCGFSSEGDAARHRRDEDVRACELLGAAPVWLPFPDMQYAQDRTEEQVWSALAPALAGAQLVLIPGFPLVNEDHAWLAPMLLERLTDVPVALYVEQPYASELAIGRRRSPRVLVDAARIAAASRLGRRPRQRPAPSIAGRVPAELRWVGVRPTRAERALKDRAIDAYVSQCAPLGGQLVRRVRWHETAAGGELTALAGPVGG